MSQKSNSNHFVSVGKVVLCQNSVNRFFFQKLHATITQKTRWIGANFVIFKIKIFYHQLHVAKCDFANGSFLIRPRMHPMLINYKMVLGVGDCS